MKGSKKQSEIGRSILSAVEEQVPQYNELVASLRRGLEDYRAGRMRHWREVKKELGIR